MAAVMQVLESWLLFQQGKWKEAVRISQAAERVLGETDDYVTLGNIQSFYGRMARREGGFAYAIVFFPSAVSHFVKRGARRSKLAPSLGNTLLGTVWLSLQVRER